MSDPLREALERAASDLFEAGGLVDALNFRARRPTKAHAKDLFAKARAALAASSPPAREEWRGAGFEAGYRPDGLTGNYDSREEAQAALDAHVGDTAADPPFDRYGLQKRTAAGPWVDVPAEGEGDA